MVFIGAGSGSMPSTRNTMYTKMLNTNSPTNRCTSDPDVRAASSARVVTLVKRARQQGRS